MVKNEVKTCSKCKKQQSFSCFNKGKRHLYGLMPWCRDCTKAYKKEWYKENSEKAAEYGKAYTQNNLSRLREMKKEYMVKRKEITKQYRIKNRERDLATTKEWRKNNIERFRKYQREYVKNKANTDPVFKITRLFRGRIIEKVKKKKDDPTLELLLWYSIKDLVTHLENQFTKEMSWENHGSYWHIDHKLPVSSFSYKSHTDKEFKECWSLNNLQPLTAIENWKKGDKIIEYV